MSALGPAAAPAACPSAIVSARSARMVPTVDHRGCLIERRRSTEAARTRSTGDVNQTGSPRAMRRLELPFRALPVSAQYESLGHAANALASNGPSCGVSPYRLLQTRARPTELPTGRTTAPAKRKKEDVWEWDSTVSLAVRPPAPPQPTRQPFAGLRTLLA